MIKELALMTAMAVRPVGGEEVLEAHMLEFRGNDGAALFPHELPMTAIDICVWPRTCG